MISKKILIPVIALAIAGAGMFGVVGAQAQSTGEPFTGLADAISQRFGLDKAQVQSVVNEYQSKHQTERKQMMQARMEEKLTQDVKDGKITEEQKQAIIKKHAEIKSEFNPESMKDATPEQRKNIMESKHAEIKSWAESQGLDPDYFMQGFGRGGKHKTGWAKP